MRFSIATVCLSGTFQEKIEAIALAGFQGIEIFEPDLITFEGNLQEAKKIIEDHGLSVVALQPFRDFEGMPESLRQKTFDRAERKFDIVQALDTDLLMVCSNVSPLSLGGIQRAADDFAELGERAGKRGIRVAYEALAWGKHINDYRDSWEIVRRADQSNIGLCLDSFHIFSRKTDLSAIDAIPSNKIFLVQIADAPEVNMDVLQHSRHFRCFPGQGDFPIVEFIQKVLEIGYADYISHEIFSDEFRSGQPRQIALDGYRSMVWLEEQLTKQSLSEEKSQATSSLINGVEFVEFAVGEKDSGELITVLEAMGFQKTHIHISKDVFLYQQGQINFIINKEPDSFAQSYNLLHGISVCALGLGINNRTGLQEKIKSYTVRPFQNTVSTGELEIPAIHGITGSLLYFIERGEDIPRFFEVDFKPAHSSKTIDFGLKQIDHLGQAVAPNEFLSSLFFYRTLFDFEPNPQYDFVDPHGIIQSRLIANKEGTVCIPIVSSQSRDTMIQRFRDRYAGSGFQQIAMNCDDIFAFAEKIDPKFVLPIPGNYYNDLDAKYMIDPQKLAQMQAFNILYDENENGKFFHLYLQEINGIFFEVAQRINYTGFGEANTTVRLAAQAREYEKNEEQKVNIRRDVSVAGLTSMISGNTKVYATIGNPIHQVRLPQIMNGLFQDTRTDAVWIPWHVENTHVQEVFDLIRHSETFNGFTITVPYKHQGFEYVDTLTPRAEKVGAINMVRLEPDGKLLGDIVDGEGFALGLEAKAVTIADQRGWMAGCGGAGIAIAVALLDRDLQSLHVHDTDQDRANAFVERLKTFFPKTDLQVLAQPMEDRTLVINATPIGMAKNDPLPFPLQGLQSGTIVCDVIMKPPVTNLLKQARQLGLSTQPGAPMLDYQIPLYCEFFGILYESNLSL